MSSVYLLLMVTVIFILCWVSCFWRYTFRRLLKHKSKYKRLNFKMDFPSIILPAGSEFAYSKVLVSSISFPLWIQVTDRWQHIIASWNTYNTKSRLSPSVLPGAYLEHYVLSKTKYRNSGFQEHGLRQRTWVPCQHPDFSLDVAIMFWGERIFCLCL